LKLFLVLEVNFVDLFLTVLLFAMLVRALMSFFMMGEESRLSMVLYYFTEPFILPVRKIFEKLGLFQGTPMDVSYFFTTLLIGMVQVLLASIPM
jgi:uncharacterized protein YggT (Ycf19 family)